MAGNLLEAVLNCGCCGGNPCCPGRCNSVAGEICNNPLPLTLNCNLTVSTAKLDPISGLPTGCFSCTGTLSLSPIGLYIGVVTGTCSGWCGGATRIFEYEVRIQCGLNPNGRITWTAEVRDNLGGNPARVCAAPNTDPPIWARLTSSCSPILLSGQSTQWFCGDLACIIPLLGIDEFFGDIIFDVLAWETI